MGIQQRDDLAGLDFATRHLIESYECRPNDFRIAAGNSRLRLRGVIQLDQCIRDRMLQNAVFSIRRGREQLRHRRVVADSPQRFGRRPPVGRRVATEQFNHLRRRFGVPVQAHRVQCRMTYELLVVIKQLPVREPGRLVEVDRTHWPNPVWEEIRERQHDLFASAGAWSATSFNLAESGRVDPVNGAYVSGGLFHTLGVDAIAGRTVTPADDVRGGGPDGLVAVVSSRFWRSRFGGMQDVVGRQLTVNRVATGDGWCLAPTVRSCERGQLRRASRVSTATASWAGRRSPNWA